MMHRKYAVGGGLIILAAAWIGGIAANPAGAASADPPVAETGTITGKVSFAPATRMRKTDLIEVVVSIEDVEVSADELKAAREVRAKLALEDESKRNLIDQKDMTFRPQALPILIGESVSFPNSDPLFHNVYSGSRLKVFNLGMYPQGQSKEETFDKAGTIELLCKVHSEMKAFILVKKNPFFTKVEADGSFKIENVPAGEHTIQVWHSKAEPVTAKISVKPGEEANAELRLLKRRGRRRR